MSGFLVFTYTKYVQNIYNIFELYFKGDTMSSRSTLVTRLLALTLALVLIVSSAMHNQIFAEGYDENLTQQEEVVDPPANGEETETEEEGQEPDDSDYTSDEEKDSDDENDLEDEEKDDENEDKDNEDEKDDEDKIDDNDKDGDDEDLDEDTEECEEDCDCEECEEKLLLFGIVLPVPLTGYTVTFNANGGEVSGGGTIDTRPTIAGNIVGEGNMPLNPTRGGTHTFIEWNTMSTGLGTPFTATTPVSGDIEVYAIWGHTVNFSAIPVNLVTTGSPNVATNWSERVAREGTSVDDTSGIVWPNNPTLDGYSFGGWFTAGVEYDGTTPINQNILLHAQWNPVPAYIATFFPSPATIAAGNEIRDVVYGLGIQQSSALDRSPPLNQGRTPVAGTPTLVTASTPAASMTMHSWRTEPFGGGRVVAGIGTVQFSTQSTFRFLGNTNVYPLWVYRVTFESLGGSAVPTRDILAYNGTVLTAGTINDNSYTWTTAAAANINAALPTTTKTTMPPNPTRAGFTFDGWHTLNGTTTGNWGNPFDGDTPVDANTTVFARWIPNADVVVTFNPAGGNWGGSTASVDRSVPVDGSIFAAHQAGVNGVPEIPTRANFIFMGFYTEQNGQGAPFYATTIVTGNMEVYAHWAPYIEINIDFRDGVTPNATRRVPGGMSLMQLAQRWADTRGTGLAGVDVLLPAYPVRTGFTGIAQNFTLTPVGGGTPTWYSIGIYGIELSGGGSEGFSVDTVVNSTIHGSGPIDLYAVWTVQLTFNANHSSQFPVTNPANQNRLITYGHSSVTNTRSNYISMTAVQLNWPSDMTGAGAFNWAQLALTGRAFIGWNVSSAATYATSTGWVTSETPILANQTVFAIWGSGLTFLPGPLGLVPDDVIDDNDRFRTVSTFNNQPYPGQWPNDPVWEDGNGVPMANFVGWYTLPIGGTPYNEFTPMTVARNLVGRWEASVNFNHNGGTGSTPSITELVGNPLLARLPASVNRDGWTFGGWNTAADGSGIAIGPNDPIPHNVTLYAQWLSRLTFNPGLGTIDGGAVGATVHRDVLDGDTLGASNLPPNVYLDDSGTPRAILHWLLPGGTIFNPATHVPTGNITLTAVFNMGNDDLTYNLNGGTGGPTNATVPVQIDDTHTLHTTPAPTHDNFDPLGDDIPVLFVGWSTTQLTSPLTANDPDPRQIHAPATEPLVVTQITMVAGGVTVYAVWGLDTTGNGTPDVLETRAYLTYDMTSGDGTSGPASRFLPIGPTITLTTSSAFTPAHPPQALPTGGAPVPVRFVGWSETAQPDILTGDDSNPTLGTNPIVVTQTTINASGRTVYAVWGFDTDNSGIPDVLEARAYLTYNMTSGDSISGPDPRFLPIGPTITLTTSSAFTPVHPPQPLPTGGANVPVLFVGWSAAQQPDILTADDADPRVGTPPIVITQTIIATTGTTVYAVWGFDTTGNGTPDVLEARAYLTYNMTSGDGISGPDPRFLPIGPTITLTTSSAFTPVHPPQALPTGGAPVSVLFVGWSETQQPDILTGDDPNPTVGTPPIVVTQTTINASGRTVFAVWGFDTDGSGTPDVLEARAYLTYDMTSGDGISGPDSRFLPIGPTITLTTSSAFTPVHLPQPLPTGGANVPVLFVGWSEAPQLILTAADPDPRLGTPPMVITQTTIATGGTTVYAVWGFDTTGNGVPDVLDTRYFLTYNLNSTEATNGPSPRSLPQLTTQTLSITPVPEHDNFDPSGDDIPVRFVGWSEAPVSNILTGDDPNPTVGTNPIVVTQTTITVGGRTVYAVWGFDTNNSGTPDVLEARAYLTYDMTSGDGTSGPASRFLPIGPTITLTTSSAFTPVHPPQPLPTGGANVPVLFVGWSATPQPDILTAADLDPTVGTPPLVITQTTIATGGTTVYAVWGFDTTGSGTPDVTDPRQLLTYDLNSTVAANGPDARSLPVGTTHPLTAFDGVTPPLAPTHDDADLGGELTPVFFIGWSANPLPILTASDLDPTVGIGTADPIIITQTTIEASGTTVYAVWGFDTTGSGTPDVTDPRFDLVYDLTSGETGTGPDSRNLPQLTTHTLSTTPVPTHEDAPLNGADTPVFFVGWSATPQSAILTAADPDPRVAVGTDPAIIVTQATIAIGGTTVYAVWGFDTTGSGTPDVTDSRSYLTYDPNGGADGPEPRYLPNETVHPLSTSPVPTHPDAPVNGIDAPVVFIGWSEAPVAILQQGETADLITEVQIETGGITVYAVWAFVYHEITFNLGGGNVNNNETPIVQQQYQNHEIGTVPAPTRAGFEFLGWVRGGAGATLSSSAVEAIVVEGPMSFVAQWNQVQQGGGGLPGGMPPLGGGGAGGGGFAAGGVGTIAEVGITPPVVLPYVPTADLGTPYTQGFPDNTFRPAQLLTRAEVAMMLFRLIESDAKHLPQANRFIDVQVESWYAQAINYLTSRNVLTGYDDDTFRPENFITRAELTATMARFNEMILTGGINSFTDVTDAHWAFTYINSAYNSGWVSGYEDGTFRPNNFTTRAEGVTLINRAIDRNTDPATILSMLAGRQLFTDVPQAHWAFYEIMAASLAK